MKNATKKSYTFNTYGMGSLLTLAVAHRVSKKKYGTEVDKHKTFQIKIHFGLFSFYFAFKIPSQARVIGGKKEIVAQP
jgi:hypothetical protein